MENLLEIKNLTIEYNDKAVVKNFNLEIKPKEIVSIVGESGSGKTTVIKSILRLLTNSAVIKSGEIIFRNKNILSFNDKELRKIRGKEISIIFQDAGLSMNPTKTVGNQFIEYIQTHNSVSKREAKEKAKIWLEKLSLNSEKILSLYPFELSGGMKQRVLIAMLMSQRPQLLLADEPTSALDATIQAQVVKELKKIRDDYGTAIILITHNMGIASYISDRIIVMKDGELIEYGEKNEIIYKPKAEYTKSLLAAVLSIE